MLTSRLLPALAKTNARNISVYSGSAISGPPTNKVSAVEKVGFGLFMTVSFLVIPAWVLTHLEQYKSHD